MFVAKILPCTIILIRKEYGGDMNVIRIGPDNVKVELTREDAQRFGLDSESEDSLLSPETARCVKKIMESVRDESGVDFCGERVAVRMFPSRDGGCELFVSRLSRTPEKQTPKAEEKNAVLRFFEVEEAIETARAIGSGGGDAYTDSRSLFLVLPRGVLARLGSQAVERVSFPHIEAYIEEHLKKIYSGDAIERLAEL